MDEKSISGLLSQLISNTDKKDPTADKVSAGEGNNFLVETLKTAAGMAGGGIEPAVRASCPLPKSGSGTRSPVAIGQP